MKCLILAAGKGSRLRRRAESKPLLALAGVPLIERAIRSAREAGADRFVVVTGHRAQAVQDFLRGLSARLLVPIEAVPNSRLGAQRERPLGACCANTAR